MSSRLNGLRRRKCQKASLGVEGRVGRREFGWNAWRYLLAQGDLPRDGSTLRRGSWVGKLVSAADARANRLGCEKKVRKQSDPSVFLSPDKTNVEGLGDFGDTFGRRLGRRVRVREKKPRSQNKVTVAAGRQKECSNNSSAPKASLAERDRR